MKKLLVLLVLTLIQFGCYAQVAKTDEKSAELTDIAHKVPYSQLKQQYDFHTYVKAEGDKFSPGWCGVGSFFIPGLGQAVTGEWGRAAGFFFTDLALVGVGTWRYIVHNGKSNTVGNICYAASLGIGIWSLIDAVNVAKVKNLYFRDVNNKKMSAVNFRIEPTLAYVPTGATSCQRAYGLSLKIDF